MKIGRNIYIIYIYICFFKNIYMWSYIYLCVYIYDLQRKGQCLHSWPVTLPTPRSPFHTRPKGLANRESGPSPHRKNGRIRHLTPLTGGSKPTDRLVASLWMIRPPNCLSKRLKAVCSLGHWGFWPIATIEYNTSKHNSMNPGCEALALIHFDFGNSLAAFTPRRDKHQFRCFGHGLMLKKIL